MSYDSWAPIGICGWRAAGWRMSIAPPSSRCERPVSSIICFGFHVKAFLAVALGGQIGGFASPGVLLSSFPPFFPSPAAPLAYASVFLRT